MVTLENYKTRLPFFVFSVFLVSCSLGSLLIGEHPLKSTVSARWFPLLLLAQQEDANSIRFDAWRQMKWPKRFSSKTVRPLLELYVCCSA